MRLKPRLLGSPLKRGKWVHELLEVYHSGGNWLAHHKKLSAEFSRLFDEEKDYYGDLPTEIEAVMRSYIWHYQLDPWIVHEVEFQVEAPFPDGSIYRGKVDSLVENQFGLWLVDHKTHKTLPDHSFRLLDAQSALYLWAAQQMGIPVLGFIWNYIRWKAPSIPVLLKDGSRLSKSPCDTDFPTYVRAIKRYKANNPQFAVTAEYKARAEYLKSLMYKPGYPQQSTFFRRDILEKSPEMLDRVVKENFRTAQHMNQYNFKENDAVERTVDRSCTFSCSYTDLCTIDLMGGNTTPIIKQNYIVGDPNDYYNDRAGEVEKD